MAQRYDRTQEDSGNSVQLEHLNLRQPDQRLATIFYLMGMGFTRDPFLMVGVDNMWINIGRSQIHLPTGNAQRINGTIGIVVPNLAALCARLQSVAPRLDGTQFRFTDRSDFVEVTCPWGNRLRVHGPSAELGGFELGMPYVEFLVAMGSAGGIARFYSQLIGARARCEMTRGAEVAVVQVGRGQQLFFRETPDKLADYDGHHLQLYLADFSGPYRQLLERGLITEESDQCQYRFTSLVDPSDGRALMRLEHEIRSLTHPLYGRVLVNRNPAQSNRQYARSRDAFAGTY
ncbi:MAG: hypothetical protein IT531_21960 [Burkholderiales bacterium]|nr:hypothetical protein [Burkholderiales bacterium]